MSDVGSSLSWQTLTVVILVVSLAFLVLIILFSFLEAWVLKYVYKALTFKQRMAMSIVTLVVVVVAAFLLAVLNSLIGYYVLIPLASVVGSIAALVMLQRYNTKVSLGDYCALLVSIGLISFAIFHVFFFGLSVLY